MKYIANNHYDCCSYDLTRLRCALMKMGLVIVEYPDLETHLNRIKDFTERQVSISNTISSGIHNRIGF